MKDVCLLDDPRFACPSLHGTRGSTCVGHADMLVDVKVNGGLYFSPMNRDIVKRAIADSVWSRKNQEPALISITSVTEIVMMEAVSVFGQASV